VTSTWVPPRVDGRVVLIAMTAMLVAVAQVRFAQPVTDGDLFWHLAYAAQMLESRTLVPDHTLYSWMPAGHSTIYCAWLAQLVLHALWVGTGLTGLFVLRYAVVAGIAALYWNHAGRAGWRASPASLLPVLVLVVTAYPGSLPKPEMFSLLLLHLSLWCYWRGKFAALAGQDPRPWLYAVPSIMMVWANTHGAHVLFAPFLLATAVGEGLNRIASGPAALPACHYRHLLAAWALCGLAVCLTPYGIDYPLQHLREIAGAAAARPDAAWNAAYQPITAGGSGVPWQPMVFAALALAFVPGLTRAARGTDRAVLLSLLATLPLSVLYIRASYVWPAVACYALPWTYRRYPGVAVAYRRLRPLPTAVSVALFAALSAATVHVAYREPERGSWVGFGIGYSNPVPEAEYLAQAGLGRDFYNTFDSGGYLLWRLHPQYRVMVDSRSFPYLDWFRHQYDFAHGRHMDGFIARYPADLAVIDLEKVACWRYFLRHPEWRLQFYGPTAAVFARGDGAAEQAQSAAELLSLKAAGTALAAFDFAMAAGDVSMAWQLLGQLETRLSALADAERLQRARDYRAAHLALADGALDRARVLLERLQATGVVADRDMLILSVLREMVRAPAGAHGARIDLLRRRLGSLLPPPPPRE